MSRFLGLLAVMLALGFCFCFQVIAQTSKSKPKTESRRVLLKKSLDDDNAEPSYKEVLGDFLASYHKIQRIDTSVICGRDTLQIHERYFCLPNSSLIIPKKYIEPWLGKNAKDFATHSFATRIIVIRNKDTVLNKVFKKVDFDKTLYKQLKEYAVIFSPYYSGFNKDKEEFALGYSITIPLTDVGVPAYIMVDNKGNYRVLNEYADVNAYKK